MISVRNSPQPLANCRVLALLPGRELFGKERGNIEALRAVIAAGGRARVLVGEGGGGDVGERLRVLGISTIEAPFGPQWSLRWLRDLGPRFLISQLARRRRCSALLRDAIERHQVTHVLLSDIQSFLFVEPALRNLDTPIVLRLGDAPPDPTKSKFQAWTWRRLVRSAASIVCISKFIANQVVANAPKVTNLSVIHNFPPLRSDSDLYPKIEVTREEGSVFTFLRQVTDEKRIPELIEAFAQVHAAVPSSRLNIIGGSAYSDERQQRLAEEVRARGLTDAVKLFGWVDDPTDIVRGSTALVVPSKWNEPLSNVPLEAKAVSVPSIVFPDGGLPELIQDGVDGIVCNDKSAESLANAMLRLAHDPGLAASMGEEARASLESRFGWDRFVRGWTDVFLDSHHDSLK